MNISKVMGIHINNVSKVMGVSRNDMVKLMGVGTSSGGEETGGDFYSKTISQSCRFNDDDAAYLSWDNSGGSAGDQKTWSFSCWLKLVPGVRFSLLSGGAAGSATYGAIRLETDGNIDVDLQPSGGSSYGATFDGATLRDPGGWYHILVVFDTTQATDSDRIQLFVNGSSVTSSSRYTGYPTLNSDHQINNTNQFEVGRYAGGATYADGYLAEVHFIDGIQCAATDFGEFKNGIWVPVEYTGSYGTNGFYLDFAGTGENYDSDISSYSSAGPGRVSSGGNYHYDEDNTTGPSYNGQGAATFDVDFGADKEIGVVSLQGRQISGYATRTASTVNIKHSDDNSNWTTAGTASSVQFGNGVAATEITFTPVSARYWRVELPNGTSGGDGVAGHFIGSIDYLAKGLGADISGNGNDFTANNLASSDQMADSPTNNYCVMSSIDNILDYDLTEGNLGVRFDALWNGIRSTWGISSGKWYWEVKGVEETTFQVGLGLAVPEWTLGGTSDDSVLSATGCVGWSGYDGWVYKDGVPIVQPGSYGQGDIMMIAFDADNGKIWYGKNGTWLLSGDPANGTNAHATGLTGTYCPAAGQHSGLARTEKFHFNFGQDTTYVSSAQADENGYGSFEYAPPSGFLALCSANLPDPAWMSDPTTDSPADAFDIVTRDGSGAAASVSSLNFSPDIVVIKNRDQADEWKCLDSVRGATKELNWDSTNAESTDANGLTSFDTNGYTLGTGADGYNDNAEAFVDYSWLESADYGIDIVSYTGTGSARTISHNLGVAPDAMIVKDISRAEDWSVYHRGMASDPETDYLRLDSTAAAADQANVWQDTAPTSTQFTVGDANRVNFNGESYIAYLFAEVEGFSRFGYYIGNGNADGPFVWCGFRPRFLIIKNVDSTSTHWVLWDTEREAGNVTNDILYPSSADAEGSDNANNQIDILSNGFKARATGSFINTSGDRYIFMAFAEFPFKYANAR